MRIRISNVAKLSLAEVAAACLPADDTGIIML